MKFQFKKKNMLNWNFNSKKQIIENFFEFKFQFKQVKFYLDRSFLDSETVNFHPLINTATVNISPQNLIELIEKYHNPVNYIDLENLKRWN